MQNHIAHRQENIGMAVEAAGMAKSFGGGEQARHLQDNRPRSVAQLKYNGVSVNKQVAHKKENNNVKPAVAPVQRQVVTGELISQTLQESWNDIERQLMETPIYKWVQRTNEVKLVIKDGGERTEESVDAYGTTAISLLTRPISLGRVLANAGAMVQTLNNAKSQARRRPLFTITVEVHTNELANVKEDDPLHALPMAKRTYITLAHEIGVHALPRLFAVYQILNRSKSTILDFLKLAKGIEEEHGNTFPHDKKGPKNLLYGALVGNKLTGQNNDPLYHAFLADVSRYQQHDSPIGIRMLEAQITKLQLISKAITGAGLSIAALVLLAIIMYFIK